MTNITQEITCPEKKGKNSRNVARKAARKMKEIMSVENMKENLHASADALFFVRLFARACQPVC